LYLFVALLLVFLLVFLPESGAAPLTSYVSVGVAEAASEEMLSEAHGFISSLWSSYLIFTPPALLHLLLLLLLPLAVSIQPAHGLTGRRRRGGGSEGG